MAIPTISKSAQFQYLVQWFEEWSDFQRQDFIPILAEKMISNGTYVNGLVDAMNSVNCQDKPMNLFQCRVKLFNDWFINWSIDERNNLIQKLSDIDETFGVKILEEMSGNKQVLDVDANDESFGLVTARPGNVIITDEINNGDLEVENQEVIDDQAEPAPIIIPDSNIPIQIVE